MIAEYTRANGYDTMLEEAGVADGGPFENYVTVIYWSMATISTIGYGDLSGQSTPERLFSIICMSCGSMIYAYILSSMISIVKKSQKKASQKQQQYDKINQYLKFRDVPEDLTNEVRLFYQGKFSNSDWKLGFENERKILKELPQALRTKSIFYNIL